MRHTPPAEALVPSKVKTGLSRVFLGAALATTEFCGLLASGFAVHSLHVGPLKELEQSYLVAIPIMSIAMLLPLQFIGAYKIEALRQPLAAWLRVALCWSGVIFAAMATAFVLRIESSFSRGWLALWMFSGLGLFAATRIGAATLVRALTRRGLLDRYLVVVGGGPLAEMLLNELSRDPGPDLRILGLFDDRDDERSPDLVAGYPKLGSIDDLLAFARHVRVDQVIFALPITAEGRILSMLRKLWVLPVDIRLAAHANRLRFRPRAYSYIGSAPMFDLLDRPISEGALLVKSLFDRIVGAALLLMLSPVMLAVALGVKLTSRGPVLFRQQRLGFNNEKIIVYKFRSLYLDQCDSLARRLVTRDDPRVTPFGRLIRKTSLDELPQLLNVLKGDLSLVGPRPHAASAQAAERDYDTVVDGYFARHRVKPGITGWAQVNGWRGETDTVEKIQRRVEYDLDYIESWSLLLDVYILALTPLALLRPANAY